MGLYALFSMCMKTWNTYTGRPNKNRAVACCFSSSCLIFWGTPCIISLILWKKNQNFFHFFQSFSVFWTPSTYRKIFLHFWAKKKNLFTYLEYNMSINPQKCFLEAYSTECPSNTQISPKITVSLSKRSFSIFRFIFFNH